VRTETLASHGQTIEQEGEVNMTDTQEAPTEFVGYRAAADYLGLARNTLSSYVSRGIGPREKLDAKGKPERRVEGQYLLPVFERAELDRWKEERPGQGARTDLTPPETASESMYSVPAFFGP
jgi:hypothetical protein